MRLACQAANLLDNLVWADQPLGRAGVLTRDGARHYPIASRPAELPMQEPTNLVIRRQVRLRLAR